MIEITYRFDEPGDSPAIRDTTTVSESDAETVKAQIIRAGGKIVSTRKLSQAACAHRGEQGQGL